MAAREVFSEENLARTRVYGPRVRVGNREARFAASHVSRREREETDQLITIDVREGSQLLEMTITDAPE